MNRVLIYCLTILMLLQTTVIFAFDNKQSHPFLTKKAVENSQLKSFLEHQLFITDGYNSALQTTLAEKSILEWLQKGSEEEDDPACRAANHFHNPLKLWSVAGLTDTVWVIDRWCDVSSPYREKYSNLVWATGYISKDLAMDSPPNNEFNEIDDKNGRNWNVARELYYHALTYKNNVDREANLAEMSRTLGYILHLLQDMAVPAHTRNDFSQGHTQNIGCPEEDCWLEAWIGNPFEGYVRDNFAIIDAEIPNISQPFSGEKELTNFWDTDTVLVSNTDIPQTGFDIGLAEYTNANFVSYATIFKEESDTEHYFPYPNRESIADQDYPDQVDEELYNILARDGKLDKGVYITKDNHGEKINNFLKPRYIFHHYDFSNWTYIKRHYKLRFTLDHQCYLEYAKRLIPRAVGYSAALLDYFFRGSIEITSPDTFIYSIIDGSLSPQQFTHIKAKLRNTSEENMGNGTLQLVAKYRERIDYQPDLSTDPPTETSRKEDFSYSVSAPIDIVGLSSTEPEEFVFNFDLQNSIPAGITDLYLQVVFRGTLGNEQDIAVAVGMKDINEPQHIIMVNSTDMIYLNGTLRTADEIRTNPDLTWPLDDSYLDPYNDMDIGMAFFSDSYPTQLHTASLTMPAPSYGRVILLADTPSFNYHVQWSSISRSHSDYGSTSMGGVVNQENGEGVFQNTQIKNFRGINAHYVRWVGWHSPDAFGLESADWPEIFNAPIPLLIWP